MMLPLCAMACVAPLDDASDDPMAVPETSAKDDDAAVSLLRHFELETGQLEVFADEHGGILLSEHIAEGHIGQIERMLVEGQTPLELYRALETRPLEGGVLREGREVPVELVAHHQQLTQLQETGERPAIIGPTLDIAAGADCTQASDLPWFRAVRQSLGHSWRYYYNRYLGSGASKATPETGLETEFMTHMCNFSISGDQARHRIGQGNIDVTTTVSIGVRHVFWWSTPTFATNYYGRMTNGTFEGGNAKLGGSAP